MEEELIVRALWFAYIGKYTQNEIAELLNISRQKVQRLVAEGIAKDYVTVEICHEISSLIELEEKMKSSFGLEYCNVIPRLPGETCAETYMESLGLAGSTYLMDLLSNSEEKIIGIGWGRTIANVAKQFYKRADMDLSRHKFVPLIGSLTNNSMMNPMNLINLFGEKTNAEAYFLPAPVWVDSRGEKKLLEKQKSVKKVLDLALKADHYFLSIGEIGSTSSLLKFGVISKSQQNELISKGAIADIIGKFIDENGELVDHRVNQLSIGLDINKLFGKSVIAVCSGLEKVKAARTVLRKKYISGLITDEDTAINILNDQ